MFFVQINHTGKGFLFLIFREIKLRKYSSLHKIFYGLSMRMDSKFKEETKENFKKMGLSMSAATNMFFTFVNQRGYLPFTPTVQKTELEQAIEDAENGKLAHTYSSFEDYQKGMNEEELAVVSRVLDQMIKNISGEPETVHRPDWMCKNDSI